MKVALAGGGTGGHAYPAVAVAERLRERLDTELVYYGTARGPERRVAADESIPFRAIPASQTRGRSPVRLLRGTWHLWKGSGIAQRLLEDDRPNALFATGGYAAAPVGRAASRAGIPLVLFLPDVRPGWAVRYMLRSATAIACAVDRSLDYLPQKRTVVTGYPVRRQFEDASREEGQRRFGLDPALPTLLIAGGSQGSHQINTVVLEILRSLLERMQLIHVCGTSEEHWISRERDRLPRWQQDRYHLFAYTDELAWAMAASDLAITRAGASIFGELPSAELPAIIVPLDASDQHLNARYLADAGAAVMLQGHELDALEGQIGELIGDPSRREEMRDAMRRVLRPNAASRIAELVREVALP